mgnify:CR=1 FL=1
MSKFEITVFFVVLSSMVAGYIMGKARTELDQEQELSKVIDWNTKQIHSLGINSAVEKQNAELLIQVLSVLEGREVKTIPRDIPLGDLNNNKPIEDDDVPHTFQQIEKDQKEVDRGIRAGANNNLFQNEALRNILEILKRSDESIRTTQN